MVNAVGSRLVGVDEIYNGSGVQLAPLGFGFSSDWEVIYSLDINTNMSTIPITDIDDAAFDEYELCAYDLDTDTTSNNLILQFSNDNGSSYDTASNYHYAFHRGNAEAAFSEDRSNAATSIQLSQNFGSATDRVLHGKWWLSPLDSGSRKHIYGICTHMNDSGTLRTLHGAGMWSGTGSTGSITAFRLSLAAGGNFTAGKIVLRGRRRAPLTFNTQDDWVVIDDQANLSAISNHDVFWDDQVWDEIEITCSAIAIGTDNTNLELQFSTDGSTFHSGATDYEWARWLVHSAGSGGSGSTGDTHIEIGPSLGTGTDEEYDVCIKIRNVSRTDKKKRCRIEGEGNIQDGLFRLASASGIMTVNNNSLLGFRISPAGAVTFSADRIRVRGRRLTPLGNFQRDWEVLKSGDLSVDSSGANLDITDIPVNEFDELELVLLDADSDTTNNTIEVRFSADNGATFDSGTNYYERGSRYQSTGNTQENNDTQTSGALINQFGSSSVRTGHGTWHIYGMNNGSRVHVTGLGISINDTGDMTYKTTNISWAGTGSTTPCTAMRLFLGTGGNWTNGRYILRGRRKQ